MSKDDLSAEEMAKSIVSWLYRDEKENPVGGFMKRIAALNDNLKKEGYYLGDTY
jgi:hypothetical protein